MADENEQQSASQTDGENQDTSSDNQSGDQQQDQQQQDNGSQENLEQVRKDAKAYGDTKIRAEKAEKDLKSYKDKFGSIDGEGSSQQQSQTSQSGDAARLDRIELTANGIKDREEQDFVLSAAKRLGISPSEAAADELIASRLERMRETKKTKDAAPAPHRGGGSSRNTKLPDFTKMTNAEFDAWEKKNR